MSDLDQLEQQLIADIAGSDDEPALESVRISALGKKGRVSELMKGLGGMSPDERKVMGPGAQRPQGPRRRSDRRAQGSPLRGQRLRRGSRPSARM